MQSNESIRISPLHGMFNPSGLALMIILFWPSCIEAIALRVVDGQMPEVNSVNSPEEDPIAERALSMQPAPYSGPEHLKALHDNCYQFNDDKYQYQLCLFSNMTQLKQSPGEPLQHHHLLGRPTLLGVWSGWAITAGQFTGLALEGGSPCGGRESKEVPLLRQAQVALHCGPRHELTAVTEPDRCRYQAHFSTPLVCGDDTVMAVYPRLLPEQQDEWDVLFTDHNNGLLTDRGYHNRLQELYEEAGFVMSEERRRSLLNQFESSGDDCSWKIKHLEEKVNRLENELSALRH